MNKLKIKIGRYLLKIKAKDVKREKSVIGLSYAKNVGIIFNAIGNKSFDLVKEFVKILSEQETQCSTIGYVNSKKIGEHYLYRKGFSFFSRKQLNWYNKPIDETIQKFIKTEYDILINLSIYDDYPIQYITGLSKAKFKVGKSGINNPYLDMMIDVQEEERNRNKLEKEIKQKLEKKEITNEEYNNLIDKRPPDERNLIFLIEQTIHYLSIINKNFVNLADSN